MGLCMVPPEGEAPLTPYGHVSKLLRCHASAPSKTQEVYNAALLRQAIQPPPLWIDAMKDYCFQ